MLSPGGSDCALTGHLKPPLLLHTWPALQPSKEGFSLFTPSHLSSCSGVQKAACKRWNACIWKIFAVTSEPGCRIERDLHWCLQRRPQGWWKIQSRGWQGSPVQPPPSPPYSASPTPSPTLVYLLLLLLLLHPSCHLSSWLPLLQTELDCTSWHIGVKTHQLTHAHTGSRLLEVQLQLGKGFQEFNGKVGKRELPDINFSKFLFEKSEISSINYPPKEPPSTRKCSNVEKF